MKVGACSLFDLTDSPEIQEAGDNSLLSPTIQHPDISNDQSFKLDSAGEQPVGTPWCWQLQVPG